MSARSLCSIVVGIHLANSQLYAPLLAPNPSLEWKLFHFEPTNDTKDVTAYERRAVPRRRCFLTGKIAYPHNSLTLDCIVKDISATGARLKLVSESIVHDPYLIVVKDALVHPSIAAWQKGEMVGLKFKDSISLASEVGLNLKHIQRIWTELMPR